jgi:hypothetical protein
VKAGKTLLVAAFAFGLLAASASAAMYLDIDPSSGSGSTTYAIAVDSGTASVTGLKLNIRLTSNGGSGDLQLLKYYGKVVSTNYDGGLILGTLSDAWNTTDLNLYSAAYLGKQQDLDSDGDIDIGGTNPAVFNDWMCAQNGNTTYVTQTDATNGIPAYTINFAGTSWVGGPSANPHGITVIQAVQAKNTYNLYREGTKGANGADTGYTITLYRPDGAALDKTQIDLKLGSGTLDASGSIGSINKWLWDFGGDGTYEVMVSGTTAPVMTFTYNSATGEVGYNDGVGDSGSYTPTAAEKAAGKFTVTMQTKYVNSSTLTHDETSAIVLLPEPATMALLGLGGLALAVRRRRVA